MAMSIFRAHDGDNPYVSATDAMCYWPETATAVAARRVGINGCDIAAPMGLTDLFWWILLPTPHFVDGSVPFTPTGWHLKVGLIFGRCCKEPELEGTLACFV